ncbi:aminotransferase-like domain-containing protein [Halopseudomonas sp.]|uniref:aminotransferase-like domain-containing protein n=1 Tax=Halopseudomonas sp. TaxID=2901191 RepID=UPI0030023ACB
MAQDLFLYENISEQLSSHIRNGSYRPGERLPSVRALSKLFGVSINTVIQSLRKLELDGYVEIRERSGAFVCDALPTKLTGQTVAHFPLLPVDVSLSEDILRYMEPHTSAGTLHLGIALPAAELMPVARIMRLYRELTRRQPQVVWDYSHPNGVDRFARQLSHRSLIHEVPLAEHDILVTNGCMEAIELALRTVTRRGDVVAVETPTYYGSLLALEVLQRRALEIPTHYRDGLCLYSLEQAFKRGQVKACLVSCNAQNPLGFCLSAERKRKLVELATRYQVPLIENDIWGDTVYSGDSLPAKAFDAEGMVIYCSSFSKSLMPGLRLGWVAAGRFHGRLRELKQISSITTAAAPQLLVGRLMESGAYAQHLQQLRGRLQAQVRAMIEIVRQSFPPGTQVHEPQGGCVLWVRLPDKRDARKLFECALEGGIHVFPGSVFSAGANHYDFLRLNAGSPLTPEIEAKLRRLGELAGLIQSS